jgi:hypothetical protein
MLTDQTNTVVLGEIGNSPKQNCGIVPAIAHEVIASRAEQAPDLSSDVVVVNVQPTVSMIGSRVNAPAVGAFSVLGDEHGLIDLKRNPVTVKQISGPLLALFIASNKCRTQLFHVRENDHSFVQLPDGMSGKRLFGATRFVIQHLLMIKQLAAVRTWLQNPATWAQFGLLGNHDIAGQQAPSVLVIVSESACFAPMLVGASKINGLLDDLAASANMLTFRQGANAGASFPKVKGETLSANCLVAKRTDGDLGQGRRKFCDPTLTGRTNMTQPTGERGTVSKFRKSPNGLASGADFFSDDGFRRECAIVTPVSLNEPARHGLTTKRTTRLVASCHYSSIFGIFASIINRRTAPESVMDHVPAIRSSLSRTGFSMRNMICWSFGNLPSISNYKCTMALAACQAVMQKISEKGEILTLATVPA